MRAEPDFIRPAPRALTVTAILAAAILLFDRGHVLYIPLGLVALATAWATTRKTPRFFIAVTVASFVLQGAHAILREPLDPAITPKLAEYEAVSDDTAVTRDGLTTFTARFERRLKPAPAEISGRIRLSVAEPCPVPENTVIRFPARVKPPRTYKNPGVFDWRRYLNRRGVFGQAFVPRCADITVASRRAAAPWKRWREGIYAELTNASPERGGTLAALVLGTRSVPGALAGKIRDSGLSHLFAISGMQFAVMSAIVYALTALATRLKPRLYLYLPRQRIAAAATILFAAAFTLVALPQPSIVRAGVMAALVFTAVLGGRPVAFAHVIVTSAALLLAFMPENLFDAGFWLSYACVLILALLVGRWLVMPPEATRAAFRRRALRAFALLAVTSWTLNILLMPLIAFIFGEVSLDGLVNNLWAVPYFDFLVTPLSLAYLAAHALSSWLSGYVLAVWDASVRLFLAVLERIPRLPGGGIALPKPHLEHVLIFYGGWLAALITRRRTVIAAAAVLLAATLGHTYYRNFLGFDLRVTQIDVGQGDATLIETPEKTVLIDAGGSAYFDVGANVLKPFLGHRWIRTVDLAVVTHADTDHYLGFAGLLDSFRIREFRINGTRGDKTYREFIDRIARGGIPIKAMRFAGEESLDRGTRLTFFSPDASLEGMRSDNDRSIVMKAERGGFSALFTGDVSAKAERMIAAAYGERLDSDLLKVAHHGARSSTSEAFLLSVTPKLALIGVGENSPYGHPHPDVIKRLETAGSRVFRTDRDGAVTVTVKGSRVTVERHAR